MPEPIIHMSQNALAQIKSGVGFATKRAANTSNGVKLLCGEVMFGFNFIGNAEIGDNGEIVVHATHKKVTCQKCIAVLKENNL